MCMYIHTYLLYVKYCNLCEDYEDNDIKEQAVYVLIASLEAVLVFLSRIFVTEICICTYVVNISTC